MQKIEHYLNDEQAADFLNLSKQTLRNWRCKCRGPAYTKAGRAIRYSFDDLKKFMEKNRVTNAG